jgi:hypothetical protein
MFVFACPPIQSRSALDIRCFPPEVVSFCFQIHVTYSLSPSAFFLQLPHFPLITNSYSAILPHLFLFPCLCLFYFIHHCAFSPKEHTTPCVPRLILASTLTYLPSVAQAIRQDSGAETAFLPGARMTAVMACLSAG